MDDITDLPFRELCKEFGADLLVTEFIASEALNRDAEKSLRKMRFTEQQRPIGIQIFGADEDELLRCDRFEISVAFITEGGITPLLQTLSELEKKNIPGRILTTNYLSFSEPKALEKLHGLKNITIKMYDAEAADTGFHTKGYIFKNKELYRIIIGSSNMTSTALASNW